MKLSKEYKEITQSILNDENFLSLKNEAHHGTNRYDHCKRVSYVSFLLAKLFKGDIKDSCISGLLHDFFNGDSSYLNHPKTSSDNAKKYFHITNKEASIIETHMYHYALTKKCLPFINHDGKVNPKEYKPLYKEGYIVCISDLLVSIFELGMFKVRYSICLYLLFIINLMRY